MYEYKIVYFKSEDINADISSEGDKIVSMMNILTDRVNVYAQEGWELVGPIQSQPFGWSATFKKEMKHKQIDNGAW